MNLSPGHVTIDRTPGTNCQDTGDRVRGFAGKHGGGVLFVFADGSTRMLQEDLDARIYRGMSTMSGDEVLPAE